MKNKIDNARLAQSVLAAARNQGLMIATAESCTGGMIAAALTDIAGSSDVFDRGFVTYSNFAKQQMLGVSAISLERFGAVSDAVAKEMAYGAISNSMANIAVSVTGVAGPGGGSLEKPVGTVWFGVAIEGQSPVSECIHFGDIGRSQVRLQATGHALKMLQSALEDI